MTLIQDIETRFGTDAAASIAPKIGNPPIGHDATSPANLDRSRGSLIGAAIGEALGEPVEERSRDWIASHYGKITNYIVPNPSTAADTQLMMMTADSVVSSSSQHPERFAARLSAASLNTRGVAVLHAQDAIRNSQPWWRAGLENSAGTSGAARSVVFGLMWSKDPQRAAYEAALSTAVTHGHPVAISAAAAFASAVALAADGDGPLDVTWLQSVAEITSGFTQGDIGGVTVLRKISELSGLLNQTPEVALGVIGTGSIALEAVPAALWCAAANSNPSAAVLEAVNAGGDTDTIALMTGACVGARYGEGAWPSPWRNLRGIEGVIETGGNLSGQYTPEQATNVSNADIPIHVSFLLDRSGSMNSLVDDVIGGFNAFVANQRKEDGDCLFTAVQFDTENPFEVIDQAIPIKEVRDLDHSRYRPRGGTPLLDALGNLITTTQTRLDSLGGQEDQIVVVFTDGRENASRTWTRDRLFALIEEKKQQGWSFIFLGANQDSYREGRGLGFDSRNIQNYRGDGRGTREAWGSVDRAVSAYRRAPVMEKTRKKVDFFDGIKEAEYDHKTR